MPDHPPAPATTPLRSRTKGSAGPNQETPSLQSVGVVEVYASSCEDLERLHTYVRDWWPVQLVWNRHYVASTQVYSSIMAVTVSELVVWVFASSLTVVASSVCAFVLCLLLDEPGKEQA